jgi:hypothetical protein
MNGSGIPNHCCPTRALRLFRLSTGAAQNTFVADVRKLRTAQFRLRSSRHGKSANAFNVSGNRL